MLCSSHLCCEWLEQWSSQVGFYASSKWGIKCWACQSPIGRRLDRLINIISWTDGWHHISVSDHFLFIKHLHIPGHLATWNVFIASIHIIIAEWSKVGVFFNNHAAILCYIKTECSRVGAQLSKPQYSRAVYIQQIQFLCTLHYLNNCMSLQLM